VTAMKGYQFPELGSRFTRETMLAFRVNARATKKEDPYPAVALQRERSVWRDSNALFFAVSKERPRTLRWLEELNAASVLHSSQAYHLDVYGLCVSRGVSSSGGTSGCRSSRVPERRRLTRHSRYRTSIG
jgi:hypothetical protein